jgi:hypothetical protein
LEINLLYDGKLLLDPIVKYVRWSGDITQASRKIDVELSNTKDGIRRLVNIEKGKELRLLKDGVELFRGVIFSDSIDSSGQMIVTAYDENIYLTKSTDTRIFRNLTAGAIVSRLCKDYGIETGTISNTGYIIPKLILRDMSLFDMMITALTVTEKQTGKRFFLCAKNGKLHLLERKTQTVKWVLENGVNIISASHSQSIEELRNQVKVIGGDEEKNPIIATVKNDALIRKFGVMQHLENADSELKRSEIEQLAKELLKQLGAIEDDVSIEALGISDVIAGSAVYIVESMTGIGGGYYVSTDEHTFQNGSHTMSLTLSATDDLPTLEYDEPEEVKEKRKKSKESGDDTATLDQVLKEIDEFGS